MNDGLLSPEEIEALLGTPSELDESDARAASRANASTESANLELLMGVPLRVSVKLGEARMTMRELLNLGKGSIVELENVAGEPVDVCINGKLIARGEVVTVDENLAVRITEIVKSD